MKYLILCLLAPLLGAAAYIDASQAPYSVGGPGDSTAGAQAALNAAYAAPPAVVVFPTAFNFTTLAVPAGVTVECGGDRNPVVRTAVGPGMFTTDVPGHAYPAAAVFGVTIRNCTFTSALAGVNLMVAEAQGTLLEHVHSSTTLAGAALTGSLSGSNTLTVNNAANGSVAVGMLMECIGCAIGPFPNTYPQVTSYAGAGVWNTTPWTPSLPNTYMVGVPSWTWAAAPQLTTFPSAAVFYMGASFDNAAVDLRAAGTYNALASACASYTSVGLAFDTSWQNGSNRPNHNSFVQLYTPCANLGVLLNNGADETFVNTDQQNDNYGFLIGSGNGARSSAARVSITQPYLEGDAATGMFIGIGFDAAGTRGLVMGTGSLSNVANPGADPTGTNCWKPLSGAAILPGGC